MYKFALRKYSNVDFIVMLEASILWSYVGRKYIQGTPVGTTTTPRDFRKNKGNPYQKFCKYLVMFFFTFVSLALVGGFLDAFSLTWHL